MIVTGSSGWIFFDLELAWEGTIVLLDGPIVGKSRSSGLSGRILGEPVARRVSEAWLAGYAGCLAPSIWRMTTSRRCRL